MNLLRALVTVSGLTFVSRILGFARDFIIARGFGASLATDAFVVAFRLPNLLRRLFAEGALSQAFVPVLAEQKNKTSPEEVRSLIDRTATLLSLALVVTALLGMAIAPLVVYISAPGFAQDPAKFDLTVTMLRIIFPYIAFISLVAFAAGVLNTWNRFSVPAITPALLNVSFIVGALFFADRFHPPVLVLAWAVFAGGVLQLAFQIPFLARMGLLPRWRLDLAHPGVRRILKLMGPAAFGVSISQISLVINTIFASYLGDGSVSWLYYADRLMKFPSGLLGVALGTILLPSLSKYHADANREEYSRLLDWGLRVTILLAVPATVALAVHRRRCLDDAPGAHCLQRGPGRHHHGQDPRAGLLRETEHRDPGQNRHHDPACDPGPEPCLHRSAQARRARSLHRPRSVPERRSALPRTEKERGVQACSGLAGLPAEGRRVGGLHRSEEHTSE